MASPATCGLASRRKQTKPQRLNEDDGPPGSELSEDMEGVDDPSTMAMDLSSASAGSASALMEKMLDESGKNLLIQSLATIATPQQILTLCAQLAARQQQQLSHDDMTDGEGETGTLTIDEGMDVTPPATPRKDVIICASSGCGQCFSSQGAHLWHLMEEHSTEKLLQCDNCGQRFSDRDQIADHECEQPMRSQSAGADRSGAASPDGDRGSVPVQDGPSFSIVDTEDERAISPSMLDDNTSSLLMPNSASLLNQLFQQHHQMSGMSAADLLAKTAGSFDSDSPAEVHMAAAAAAAAAAGGFGDGQTPSGVSLQSLPGCPITPTSNPMFPLTLNPFGHHSGPQFFMRPFDGSRADLFPSSGSGSSRPEINTDDDWEALMEISTTDEAEKIRALVGDKAMPTTDPNQCILCRRVLSCKSALQMHYRTHTGERPFKCKICQRAFTTKGNLKTHMGVHRAKHSFRGVPLPLNGVQIPQMPSLGPHIPLANLQAQQQCPICQKRCMTPGQLQSHMAEHRQALTGRNIGSSLSSASSLASNGSFPAGLPLFSFFSPPFASCTSEQGSVPSTSMAGGITTPFNLAQLLGKQLASAEEIRVKPASATETSSTAGSPPPASTSDFDEKKDDDMVGSPEPKANGDVTSSISPSASSDASHDQTDGSSVSRCESEGDMKTNNSDNVSTSSATAVKASDSAKADASIDDLASTPLSAPLAPSSPRSTSDNPLEAMQKMWAETEPPPPRQMPVLSKHQCGVCFKHFSSSSALQIHMRTHTGDKPFKCEMCGRAFTTRGNLKVHMGTHMWQQSPSRRGRRIFDASPPTPSPSDVVVSPIKSSSNSGISLPAGLQPPLGLFPPGMPNMEMMMLLWRTVCSVCQKVCASPTELEQHLRDHLDTPNSATTPSSAASPQPTTAE